MKNKQSHIHTPMPDDKKGQLGVLHGTWRRVVCKTCGHVISQYFEDDGTPTKTGEELVEEAAETDGWYPHPPGCGCYFCMNEPSAG